MLVSTHLVGDLEAAADRILVLHKGRLIANGSPTRLIEAAQGWVRSLGATVADLPELHARYVLTDVQPMAQGVAMRLVALEPPAGVSAQTPSLEEAYLVALKQGAPTPM